MKTQETSLSYFSKKYHNLEKVMLAVMFFILFTGTGKIQAQCGYALEFEDDSLAMVYWNPTPEILNNFTMEFWVKPFKSIMTGMVENVNINVEFSYAIGQNFAVFPWWYPPDPPIDSLIFDPDVLYNVGGPAGAGVSVGTNGVAVFEHAAWYFGSTLVYYTPISSSEWTHIAVVYTNKQPALYINGSWVYTGITSLKDRIHPSACIGIDSPWHGPFDGTIDEFRIWDISLSPATILTQFNQPVSPSHPEYTHLHTYWNFNEGPGTLVQDASGNGHVGYIWNSFSWIPGWIPEGATLPVVDAGTDVTTYFGISSMQEVTRTAIVTGGAPPFSFEWTLDRPLLCNQENSNGDETFSGGTCANNTCPESGSLTETTSCSGSETITATLLDTAVICVTVTDANGCTATDCFTVNASDVRCFSGNGGNSKVKMCHHTNSPNNPWVEICVEENAIDAHLAHGDDLGACDFTKSADPEVLHDHGLNLNLFPNPATNRVTIEFETSSENSYSIKLCDLTGRKLKVYNGKAIPGENTIEMELVGVERGIYLVKLELDGKEEVKKIVKE